MKLSVYYESNFKSDYVWLDTGDEDLNVMIENDYQQRLAKAKDGDVVARRDPQTILDEEISKPTYNSHHREARRSVLFSALDPEGDRISDGSYFEDDICDQAEYEEVRAAMKQLNPQQRKLLKKIFWDELSQREIADQEGVRENSLSDRKKRALTALQKILEKNQK